MTSNQNTKGLRQLYDTVESNVRSLKSLGGLLTSILINKLPQDFRRIVTRKIGDEDWALNSLLVISKQELEARERVVGPSGIGVQSPPAKPNRRGPGTIAALFAGTSGPTCTFCRRKHSSRNCQTVTDALGRKELLRKKGRCYICLRRDHISPDCTVKSKCYNCNGRHPVSIC